MPEGYRTISGALFRAPNIEHNNRDHIPWNAKAERMDQNWIPVNGTQILPFGRFIRSCFRNPMKLGLKKSIRNVGQKMHLQLIMKKY